MDSLTHWLDQTAERLCAWLNGLIPGKHRLVVAGYQLAGLRKGFLLPVDRRRGPTVLRMNDGPSMTEKMKKSLAKGGTSHLETDCGFWAYCHISGQPCQRCRYTPLVSANSLLPGQSKDLVFLCKQAVGKKSGTFWYGCCKNPKGEIRIIGFGDCCTPGYPAPQDCDGGSSTWCENWPAAKNWCYSSGSEASSPKTTYFCTIAVDIGECTT